MHAARGPLGLSHLSRALAALFVLPDTCMPLRLAVHVHTHLPTRALLHCAARATTAPQIDHPRSLRTPIAGRVLASRRDTPPSPLFLLTTVFINTARWQQLSSALDPLLIRLLLPTSGPSGVELLRLDLCAVGVPQADKGVPLPGWSAPALLAPAAPPSTAHEPGALAAPAAKPVAFKVKLKVDPSASQGGGPAASAETASRRSKESGKRRAGAPADSADSGQADPQQAKRMRTASYS